MKFIIGEKVKMTHIFDAAGNAVPVTVVRAFKNIVLGLRTAERDGYAALQVGAGEQRERRVARPQRGFFKDNGNFRLVKECRLSPDRAAEAPAVGSTLDVSQFTTGDAVTVVGISKGKGFQGVVKRHGFHGAPATHGTKHAHREPGGIGGSGGRAGGRVAKGIRMAGRMGGERVSVRNATIVEIDIGSGLIAVRGAVPGRRGSVIEIRG